MIRGKQADKCPDIYITSLVNRVASLPNLNMSSEFSLNVKLCFDCSVSLCLLQDLDRLSHWRIDMVASPAKASLALSNRQSCRPLLPHEATNLGGDVFSDAHRQLARC
jgi:hypothetical protein